MDSFSMSFADFTKELQKKVNGDSIYNIDSTLPEYLDSKDTFRNLMMIVRDYKNDKRGGISLINGDKADDLSCALLSIIGSDKARYVVYGSENNGSLRLLADFTSTRTPTVSVVKVNDEIIFRDVNNESLYKIKIRP